MRSAKDIRDWLIARLAELAARDGKSISALHDGVAFRELGVDSVRAAQLVAALGEWLGREVELAMLYDHSTVRALADALTGAAAGPSAHASTVTGGATAVAIVGIGCRFAGADGVKAFWEVLRDNVDAIGPRPAARAQLPEARHWRGVTRGDACFREGGYLEDIDRFDARFFGISEAEATRIDPQQRLLLEVTYDALVDAAIAPSSARGSATGVYVGISTSDYGIEQLGAPAEVDAYTGAGSAASVAANRLSYFYDFQGPSMAIDTACSSSAVAIHEACLAIRRGEVELAIAAGVNVILSPSVTMNFVQAGVMASDARCKTFSDAADGYVRAEGVGAIVLKPLAQARADGDRIYAVVLGGAVNHGGRSNGLMSPSGRSQARVLEAALSDAGIKPRDLDYIEAHGTGTFVGDPIEVNALGRALAVGLARTRKCLLGSVKTNIGHTEAAAGIAGVIKVALSLYHRTIPASLHAEPANTQIRFDELPIRVAVRNQVWPGRPGHACASVASIGFGGTNCQLVLAEPAHPVAQLRAAGATSTSSPDTAPAAPLAPATQDLPWMLPISSATPQGLRRSAAAWAVEARTLVDAGKLRELRELVDRAARGRDHHARRAGFAADDAHGLVRALEAGVAGDQPGGAARVVFVCPGQGSQWLGMGRRLLAHEPVFRAAFAACDEAIRPLNGRSLLELVLGDDHGEYLADIGLVQPTLFAFQVAFAALWKHYGIEPAAVIGHSMGEVGAAHIAGALSLEDAARVIALRSQLMKRVVGQGMMAFVDLSVLDAIAVIAPYDGRVSIAASNSPSATVLSGDAGSIKAILDALEAKGVFARPVRVDVASHSSQVDPILDDLRELLAPVRPQAGQVPMWSTVLGRWVEGPELDAEYWVRNLRDPVRFADAVAALADPRGAFVELSPHPVLLAPIEQCLRHAGLAGSTVAAARRDRDERLCVAEALTALYQVGCDVTWPVQSERAAPALGWAPGYAWDDQRYWWSPSTVARAQPAAAGPAAAAGPSTPSWEAADFWQGAIEPATAGNTRIWQFSVDRETCGVTASHRVGGRVVLPAALFLTLGVQAAAAAWRVAPRTIELAHVRFDAPVIAEPAKRVQLTFEDTSPADRPRTSAAIKLFERDSDGAWQLASEAVACAASDRGELGARQLDLPRHIEAWPERYCDRALYQELDRLGVQYGAHFQGVKAVWRANGEALGQIIPTLAVASGRDRYAAHPALIDAAFHLAWAALEPDARDQSLQRATARVPAAVERVQIWEAAPRDTGGYWSVVRRRPDAAWDVDLFDGAGEPRVRIDGLRLAPVSASSFAGSTLADDCFTLAWRDSVREHADAAPASWVVVGDPADRLADQVRAELIARGERARMWSEPQPAEPDERVIYLPSPALPAAATPGAPPMQELCEPLLALVQSFARGERPSWRSLTIATRNAQAVHGGAVATAHAPLWGMGRVIAAELPSLPTRLIDLDDDHHGAQLVDELRAPDTEVALRAGHRFVPRLAPAAAPESTVQLRDTATYLVTGGAGGLGSLVARRFVEAGAGCVVLCGRRSDPPPDITAWLAGEPRARYVAVDVADRAAVARLIHELSSTTRPVAGVVHAAGILKDATLEQLTPSDLAAVMAPKRDGLWNLHAETAELPLDFFVAFSSATALVGSPGQANYAAANAYVDQLCWVRRAEGKPALTINWGPWAEVGLAAAEHRGRRLAALGVRSITPEAGVSCLMALLGRGEQGQVVVLPLDRDKLRASHAMASSPVLAEILAVAPVGAAAAAASPDRPAPAQLESFLRDQLAAVLRRPAAEVDVETPFPELGLESLEVLRFKNCLELALGLVLPATVVWKHPTIRALAKRLEHEMGNAPTRSR